MTYYKIASIFENKTTIIEYWDDLIIKSFVVYEKYTGGDLKNFIESHNHYCHIHFDNLNEFHRRAMILEF